MGQLIASINDMVESLEDALRPRQVAPGFIAVPRSVAPPLSLPPWFIDRCRRAYLSIAFDGPSRVIGVTSATHGEGKSMIAIGIGMAIAADTQEPTLLLECELERPSFHEHFDLPRERGLTEWLDGSAPLRLARLPYLPQLVVIPAGAPRPDPARLLYQLNGSSVMSELKMRFPNIILDLPPMLDMAYSSLATKLAESILVVARSGATRMEDLEKVMFLLGRERVAGIVLNATEYRTPEWLRRLF